MTFSRNVPSEWDVLVKKYEAQGELALSTDEIQSILTQMQVFINSKLPDSDNINQRLRTATDAIFKASLILAEGSVSESRLKKASQEIYLAIKALSSCDEIV